MLFKDVVAQFNVKARTEYNKNYKEFEPKFKNLLFEYNSGPVESMNFVFTEFLNGMEKFTGTRQHQTFPEGYKFIVTNEEWDMGVKVKVKDLERAAQVQSLTGLDIYKLRISQMPKQVKDHPIELAFDMLEAGDASTYGTTFDLQNLFDTTHNYGPVAGSQSNIVSGTGITIDKVYADLLTMISRFNSFTYLQGGTGNSKKRKLNPTLGKLLCVVPVELDGIFFQLKTKDNLGTTLGDNKLKNLFDYVSLPFTDLTDWYGLLDDESMFKPFLYQIEKPPLIDLPTPNDESIRNHRIVEYGAYGRYQVAYGAWWKAIQVVNS